MLEPFRDSTEHGDQQILEGFLCPICKVDLKTPDRLLAHAEKEHSEEQDILKSFKEILITAKKKIRYFDENIGFDQSSATNATKPLYSQEQAHLKYPPPAQVIGTDLNHISYFNAIRTPRLERYATETNKLIIRLHKLLTNRPTDSVQQKQHEQTLVPWLDGDSVKLCPCCARKFNITRRKHHCRLCGSIMCHDCSQFLAIPDAICLVNPTVTTPTTPPSFKETKEVDTLRLCDHCLHLLQNRKDMQDSQNYRPPITLYYDKIDQLKRDIAPDTQMYRRMIASLYDGDSIFTLADASALRAKIGHVAEKIDAYSKAILSLECPKGSREESLKKSVRLACIQYIKDEMLSLDPLPLESEIQKLQAKRKRETEQRIERERRINMERWELTTNNDTIAAGDGHNQATGANFASGSAVASLDNWSGRQANMGGSTNDPLVEQINIIKGYIKQARDALRFEEVATLEINLRELQQEFYHRQHKP